MNKQTYALLGGVLLASTALTSTGFAATIRNGTAIATGALTTAALTALPLSTQVFSATASTAAALSIGGAATTTTAGVLIDFSANLTSAFNVELNVSNASLTGATPTVLAYTQSTSGTASSTTTAGCGVQLLGDKLLITNCTPVSANGTSGITAVLVTGLTYNGAGALATAGQSITLSGTVKNSSNTTLFENITAASFITSKASVDASVATASTVSLTSTGTVPFSNFTGAQSATSAIVASIKFSGTNALAADLATTISDGGTSTSEVKLVYSLFSDPAFASVTYAGAARSNTSTQVTGGAVSFQLAGPALTAGNDIVVAVNGTVGASATSGTATVTVTPTASATSVSALAPFSGTLASISRTGLNTQVNTVLQSALSAGYRSFVRIANTSSVAGTATIIVRNDTSGAIIGTFTTASIAGGATLQLTATDIEAGVAAAAATGQPYKLNVSGTFAGYVQHLLFNVGAGAFTDASSFRAGAGAAP